MPKKNTKKNTRKNKSTDNLSGLLDEHDIAIIAQLRNDGRMAYRAIAEIVGLSEAAVRQRVNRLVNNDICQITAVMDPKALGLNAVASVGMKVNGDLDKIADKIATIKQVEYIILTAGMFDLMAELVCKDYEELLSVLRELRSLPEIQTTELNLILETRKLVYNRASS
jgi:Lrp/AsnC family transcriptional regulator for asnA, asnC and gidA